MSKPEGWLPALRSTTSQHECYVCLRVIDRARALCVHCMNKFPLMAEKKPGRGVPTQPELQLWPETDAV